MPIRLIFLPGSILCGNYVAYILLLYNTRKGLAYQEYPKISGGLGMLKMIRTALKYGTLGLLAGVILAPRKGEETRKLLADRTKQLLHEVVNSDNAAPA